MKNYIFEGSFSRYLDCLQVCDEINSNRTFPFEKWVSRQKDFLVTGSQGIPPRQEEISRIQSEIAATQIVDFGGGSGWIFKLLEKKGLSPAESVVVETPTSIAAFQEMNTDVKWVSTDELLNYPSVFEKSIFYSNSCIQYLPNYEVILESILKGSWEYIILEDIPNFKDKDIWTCQNYYGYLVPYHFFKKDNLISLIESYGYELTQESNYESIYPADWKYQIAEKNAVTEPGIARTLVFRRQK